MSIKATIKKPSPVKAQIIDVDTAEGADQLARELGITSITTVGTEAGVETVPSEMEQGTSRAVATRPSYAVAENRFTANSGGALEGEFEQSDFKIPQIKIVNGSGELSQKFNQGSLILGDQLLWFPPNLQPGAKNPSLFFVPIKIKKQFRENLTQEEVQEGLLPRVVSSRAEAEALTGEGATLWQGHQKPRWSPSAACMFLVSEPEHLDNNQGEENQFSQLLDNRNWTLAMYYAGGMGYNESAKVLLSNAYTVLRVNGRITLHKRLWTLQVARKKAGNFGVFVPALRLTKEDTGPDTVTYIEDMVGSSQSNAAVE